MTENANKKLHLVALIFFSLIVVFTMLLKMTDMNIIAFIFLLISLIILVPPSWLPKYPSGKLFRNLIFKIPMAIVIILIGSKLMYSTPYTSAHVLETEWGRYQKNVNGQITKKPYVVVEFFYDGMSDVKVKIGGIDAKKGEKKSTFTQRIDLQPGKNKIDIVWEGVRINGRRPYEGKIEEVCYYKNPQMVAIEAAEKAQEEEKEYCRDSPFQVYLNTSHVAPGDLTSAQKVDNAKFYNGKKIENWSLQVRDVVGGKIEFYFGGAYSLISSGHFEIERSDVKSWGSIDYNEIRRDSVLRIKSGRLQGRGDFKIIEVVFF